MFFIIKIYNFNIDLSLIGIHFYLNHDFFKIKILIILLRFLFQINLWKHFADKNFNLFKINKNFVKKINSIKIKKLILKYF